jgi:O-antigen/teichoic acid export membrane protein
MWMVSQTMLTKVASIAGQIVVAWYLTKGDMGLVGLALGVAAIPSVLRDAGLQQILVQRHANFRRWVGPVFWMSLALGLISGMLLLASAPIAAHLYRAPELKGLIPMLALATLANALATVPSAAVQAALRYRFQSILGLTAALLTVLLNIVLAKEGFRAYSFVLPYLIINTGRAIVLWIGAPTRITFNLHLRRWKYLVGDSGILLTTAILGMLISQGDYLTLGLFSNKETVGIFYFAFGLSTQTLTLLTVNLGNILFPALNKLGSDQKRQVEAFLRAARVFGAIAIPLCLLQAAASDPGMRLVFKAEWYPAIPVLQILSVAMVFRSIAMPALSLASAQQRNLFNLQVTVFTSVTFLSVVALAAWIGKTNAPVTVAFAELIFFALTDPLYIYLVLRYNNRGWKDVFRLFAAPATGGAVAAVVAGLASQLVPTNADHRGSYAVKLIVAGIVMIAVYVPLLRMLSRNLFDECVARIASVLPH